MLFTRTLKLGVLAALMLPAIAFAGEDKAGPYDLWLSQEGDDATYAVVNKEAGARAVAEVVDGKASMVDAARAEELLAGMNDAEAGDKIFMLRKSDEGDVEIFREDTDARDITIVTTEDEKVTIKIDADIDIDTDAKTDTELVGEGVTQLTTEDGTRKIIIVDIDKETDGEEKKVRRKIKINKMPETPTPPTPPTPGEDVDVTVSSKSAYKYNWTDDGESRQFIRITGATADEARDFINDLDHLSRRQKRQMREAAGL